jgi:hypothetical protein
MEAFMRADVWAVMLVLALPAVAQRGVVSGVTASNSSVDAGAAVDITVTGTNPCGAVRLDYGDGTERITHAITQVPVTIRYVYKQPGNYQIRAEGMGNCDGERSTSIRVLPQRTAPPPPERRVDPRFRQMDDNNDGVVTLSEWRGSARSFRVHDANRDGVLSRGEFPASDNAPNAPPSSDHVIVNPTVRWTDTGVYVREGELVRVDSSGTVQLSTDPADNGDPGGVRSGRRVAAAPLASRPAGALIARVGSSAPIFVGTNPTFRAPATGQLYLGVNDDHLADNRGQFRVKVDVGRRDR